MYSYIIEVGSNVRANNHGADGASKRVIKFVVETLLVMSGHKLFTSVHVDSFVSDTLNKLSHGAAADCSGGYGFESKHCDRIRSLYS